MRHPLRQCFRCGVPGPSVAVVTAHAIEFVLLTVIQLSAVVELFNVWRLAGILPMGCMFSLMDAL